MSEIVSTVPILKGLRQEGPTFYTLSSAVNDSIMLFANNDNIGFNFSKFVCIKLPIWENVAKQRLYYPPVDLESSNDSSASDTPSIFFTKAYLQNYIENFSMYIDANRDDLTLSNFAEAAFWKSLQSVSNPIGNPQPTWETIQLEVDSTYLDEDNVTREKFKEIANAENEYEQIIQYVGDINMLNHVKSSGKEYLEVYAHIPVSAGRDENVLLKYNEGLSPLLAQVPADSGPDWIAGQEDNYNNADASDKTYAKAVYDTADNKYNVNTDKDQLEIDWNDIENDTEKWDNGNFEFNAILLYYDIWEKNDPSTIKRNLYGILLVDNFEQVSPGMWRIPSFTKLQPNVNQAGNAFGFRFNLMFSNNTNQLTSEITINDYSTLSMELYMEALQRMQKIQDSYNSALEIMQQQQITINQLSQQLIAASEKVSKSVVEDAPVDNNSYVRQNGQWVQTT